MSFKWWDYFLSFDVGGILPRLVTGWIVLVRTGITLKIPEYPSNLEPEKLAHPEQPPDHQP